MNPSTKMQTRSASAKGRCFEIVGKDRCREVDVVSVSLLGEDGKVSVLFIIIIVLFIIVLCEDLSA